MGNISPLSPIPVSYSTTIPGDTTLYYVQAVLRDTQSSKILQTLDLANVSSIPNRYTGLFNAVSDPSGLGRPVDITITVYTDSGYTAPSPNYSITQYNYVVLQPWLPTLGSGGGLNIDYVKLQKMFDGSKVGNEELLNEKLSSIPEFDYDRIEVSHREMVEEIIQESVAELKNDLQKILSGLELSKAELSSGQISHSEEMQQTLSKLERIVNSASVQNKTNMDSSKQELSSTISKVFEDLRKIHDQHSRKMEEKFKHTTDSIQDYLSENLSGKELQLNVPALSFTPSKRKSEDVDAWTPERAGRLLQ